MRCDRIAIGPFRLGLDVEGIGEAIRGDIGQFGCRGLDGKVGVVPADQPLVERVGHPEVLEIAHALGIEGEDITPIDIHEIGARSAVVQPGQSGEHSHQQHEGNDQLHFTGSVTGMVIFRISLEFTKDMTWTTPVSA